MSVGTVRDQRVLLDVGLTAVVWLSPETHCQAYVYPDPDPPEPVHVTGGSMFGAFVPRFIHFHVVVLKLAATADHVVALAVFD